MKVILQICTLLVLCLVAECRRKGRHHAPEYGSRSSRFPETCDGVTCPNGMGCQMEEQRFCRRGACMFPFCVRSGPIMVSSVDNGGVCPMSTEDTTTGCSGNTVQVCSNDTLCEINQKCCVVGCGLNCVNVTSETMARSRLTASSRFRARNFAFTARANRTLHLPTRAHAGAYFCPTVPGDAFGSDCATSQCNSDDDCTGNQKCCVAGCGRRCLNPVSIMGVANSMDERAMHKRLSGRNGKAGSRRKAGRNGKAGLRGKAGSSAKAAAASNTTTVAAAAAAEVTSKPGVCPSVAVDVDATGRTECVEDLDCAGSMKCCAHGLGLACFEPFNIALPSVMMSSRMALQLNDGDSRDLLRIRGMCPPSVSGFSCGTGCSVDLNCTSNQLCCPMGSCSECSSPVISSKFMNSRPGLCPSFSPDLGTICLVSCTMDNECEIPGTKCCSVGCSRQCVNPIATATPMIKAGSCPVPTKPEAAAQAETTPATTTQASRLFDFRAFRRHGRMHSGSGSDCKFARARFCRSDASCVGMKKCCKDACDRFTCTDAV